MSNRTYIPCPGTEDPDRYKENDLHPIVIGDTLKNGRYRIVHKLGAGSFSTVWLSRDTNENKWVSLKVLSAETPVDCKELRILQEFTSSTMAHDGRQYVVQIRDHFLIDGPNGKHWCLVTAVAGQRLSRKPGFDHNSLEWSRRIGLQIAQALGFIHSLGIAHGDLYTSNILFQLENFDEWSEADLYECIGQPVKHKVCRLDGKPIGRNAPEYTVEAGNVAALESRLCADRILLIDFGEAFYHHEKPHEIFTAAPFASPELIFDGDITYAIDKWAFGCVLYEICADISLFKLLFGWFNDIRKDQVAMLGKPPDLIWENWKNSKKYFYSNGTPKDPEGRGLKVELYSLEERVRNIARPPSERRFATLTTDVPLSKDLQHLYDLLRRIMLYDPGSRLSLESIQAHPLFCTNN